MMYEPARFDRNGNRCEDGEFVTFKDWEQLRNNTLSILESQKRIYEARMAKRSKGERTVLEVLQERQELIRSTKADRK